MSQAKIAFPTPIASTAARVRWAGAILVLAGMAAYATSFRGEFQFDDLPALSENPTLRHLWPPGGALAPPHGALTVSGRPLLNLSFALNYAVSADRTWSYHAVNLAIHLAAGLAMFGLIRRTLSARGLGEGREEIPAALVAGLWLVHPLTTESVTYVVQRAESLASLWYLLTIYAFIRGRLAVSVACCAFGMATKEIVASAPLAVLLYDRAFVSGGWRPLWVRRRRYYAALAATWVVLAACMAANGWNRGATTGFGVGTPWWPYWRSQGEAVARYVGLVFWPAPLALDYGPSTAPPLLALGWFAVALGGAATAIVAAVRGRPWAFAPACALLILAPTSLVPGVLQFMAEHRAYLATGAVLVSLVVPGFGWADRRGWGRAALAVGVAAGGALAARTAERNLLYRSSLALWADTVRVRPGSPTAQANLAQSLLVAGRTAEALPHCLEAVRLDPHKPNARYNLGLVYEQQQRFGAALGEFAAAADLNPRHSFAAFHAGRILDRMNRPAEAERFLRLALAAAPQMADAHASLGVAEAALGRTESAISEYRQALALDPSLADVEFNLATLLMARGRLAEAAGHDAAVLRLRPDHREAALNRGVVLAELGRLSEARAALEDLCRRHPDWAEAQASLALVLDQAGESDAAVARFAEAIRLKPAYPEAHYNYGNARLRRREWSAARAEFAAALRLDPGMAPAREMLERMDAVRKRP